MPGECQPPATAREAVEGAARRRVLVVSPCRNEARTLARTLACVEHQTLQPLCWVIVDDGSNDETPGILQEAVARIPWLQVVRRPDRGFRKVGGGVVDAFYAGLEATDVEYDYLVKLDVDLEFGPNYLEHALEHFDRDPKLAAISGKVFRREGDRLIEEFMVDEMVAGQFKLYRREAFEEIGGFVREVMWDGIDFHRCRMRGWRTASVADPELRIVHLRLMGSSDRSVYRGRIRWGEGQWFMGSSPAYVFASGLFRMRERPRVIGGLLLLWGYLRSALGRRPRYEAPGFRRSLRSWQWQRLRRLLRTFDVR